MTTCKNFSLLSFYSCVLYRHGAHNWEGPGTLTAMTALDKLQEVSFLCPYSDDNKGSWNRSKKTMLKYHWCYIHDIWQQNLVNWTYCITDVTVSKHSLISNTKKFDWTETILTLHISPGNHIIIQIFTITGDPKIPMMCISTKCVEIDDNKITRIKWIDHCL